MAAAASLLQPPPAPLALLAAAAAEALLAALHAKALLCIGRPIPATVLSSRRFTFFGVDAAMPWLSLAALIAVPPSMAAGGAGAGRAAAPLLLLAVAAHSALHAFYIYSWGSAHTRRVLQLTAARSLRARAVLRVGRLEAAWFYVGTAFDIAVHAALAAALASAAAAAVVSGR